MVKLRYNTTVDDYDVYVKGKYVGLLSMEAEGFYVLHSSAIHNGTAVVCDSDDLEVYALLAYRRL